MILASQFHFAIARSLVRGATETLHKAGISAARIRTVWVPGAFELPVAAARASAAHPRPEAIIAVGALVRGDTIQYEVIAHAAAAGLTQVALTSGVPVTFGVIVAQTLAQAKARAGGAVGNRGAEAAQAALATLEGLAELT